MEDSDSFTYDANEDQQAALNDLQSGVNDIDKSSIPTDELTDLYNSSSGED